MHNTFGNVITKGNPKEGFLWLSKKVGRAPWMKLPMDTTDDDEESDLKQNNNMNHGNIL
jgi:hypothetical protein